MVDCTHDHHFLYCSFTPFFLTLSSLSPSFLYLFPPFTFPTSSFHSCASLKVAVPCSGATTLMAPCHASHHHYTKPPPLPNPHHNQTTQTPPYNAYHHPCTNLPFPCNTTAQPNPNHLNCTQNLNNRLGLGLIASEYIRHGTYYPLAVSLHVYNNPSFS